MGRTNEWEGNILRLPWVTVGYRWVTGRLPAGYRNRGLGYRPVTGPSGKTEVLLSVIDRYWVLATDTNCARSFTICLPN